MKTTAILLSLLLLPLSAGAQTNPPDPESMIQKGSRIRVDWLNSPKGRAVATFEAVSLDSIHFVSGERYTVAFSDIERLEVSRGRNRLAGAQRGALIGFGIGFGAPTVFHISQGGGLGDLGMYIVFFAPIYLTTTLLGGLVGFILARERWQPVSLTEKDFASRTVRLAPVLSSPGGMGLRLTLSLP